MALQPFRLGQPFTAIGDIIASGDLYAGLTASVGTGGGKFQGRHFYVNVAGGIHVYDLDSTVFELFRIQADGQPANAVEFKVGDNASPLSITAMSIDTSTGDLHLAGRLSVDEGADFAKAGGVTIIGQSTTSGIVTPLTIQAKNSAGTVVSSITFNNTGTVTITNSSGLAVPFVISSGAVRAQAFGQNTETNAGTFTTTGTIDWPTNGASQRCTLTNGTACTLSFTAPSVVGWYTLRVIAPASGSVAAITWPATVKWEAATKPVPSLVNRSNVFRFYFDGTNYWGDAIINAA